MFRTVLPLATLALFAAACSSDTTSPSTAPQPATTTRAATVDATTATTEAPPRPPACDARWEAQQTGVIESAELTEISGAAISSTHEGTIWLHNDSGNDPAVYAVDIAGTELARISLPNLSARDWEDMAIGPGPDPSLDYLYLADIGDNSGRREDVGRGPQDDPLSRIARLMRLAEERTAKADASGQTRKLQEKIVDDLNELIKQVRRQRQKKS